MANKRRNVYSPHVNMPGTGAPKSYRGVFAFVLCVLIPPLGLLFLWRKEVFPVRGRLLVTVLATVEMGFLFSLSMPRAGLTPMLPTPVGTVQITPAPDNAALNALSNMDQLLLANQQAEATATPEPISQESELAEQQAILNTTVYCVTVSGARFYHTNSVCDGQQNPRALTVEEALMEGLGPCKKCNPPNYTGG